MEGDPALVLSAKELEHDSIRSVKKEEMAMEQGGGVTT